MRISDWSSDVCSSDLIVPRGVACPAAAFEGRRSVRLAVNSASSTIPCRASSSLISRCSHYVCQIVVWRTNLEVTPGANLRRIQPMATRHSTHPHTHKVGVRTRSYDAKADEHEITRINSNVTRSEENKS